MKNIVMDEVAIKRAISRISYEIIEKNKGTKDIIFVGILTRGNDIAKRISEKIYEVENIKLPVYPINITNFRDDIKNKNQEIENIIEEDINKKKIILVDDVLHTGRSVRAAMDGVLEQGRPSSIQLVVLVDRGHRELPIRSDYVGKNIPTSKSENIEVKIKEIDEVDQVYIEKL